MKSLSPCIDGGGWVAQGFIAFLPVKVVSSDCTVACFSHYSSTSADELVEHEAMTTEAIGHDLCENLSIVVLQRQHESTLTLDYLCCHLVNPPVLIVNQRVSELLTVMVLVNLLEDAAESTVILLKRAMPGRQLERHLLLEGALEAVVRKCLNRLVSVVHRQEDPTVFRELVHLTLPAK
jgi:hypothetical protein